MTRVELVDNWLRRAAVILNDDSPAPCETPVKVGVDLGTADIQTLVLATDNTPLACFMDWANVVRDGVVVDYFGAARIVADHLRRASARLGLTIDRATTSFPPGTDPRISINVVEAAGIEVSDVIDEPSSVAALLQLEHAAVVDIGGGTTGTAVIEQGRVVKSADDPTGGRHITLALAGHFNVPFEEAERLKLEITDRQVLGLVAPVIVKMADLVKEHIAGYSPPAIYLTGGCCALPSFVEVFAAEFPGIDVILPNRPLHLTPLAIAAFCGSVHGHTTRHGMAITQRAGGIPS
ncbi:MAG: ethanolamine utilization protein EutJ [Halioglobus sp.]|nr:ethanolamine utilization protein EutJ [Halioglobus sp.]